jgi:lysophospholipase L1-like esterase
MMRRVGLASLIAALAFRSPADARPPAHVLVYGDSNSWGWTPEPTAFPTERLARGERWPDVMAARLGRGAIVSVDALSGRTVDVDYPEAVGTVPGRDFNGARFLRVAIARELPLDLVVIMLGTNDVRADLDRTPKQIAAGIRTLVDIVRSSAGGVLTDYPAPRVLVVIPPHVEDTSKTPIGGVMAGAQDKSRALAAAVTQALAGTDTPVFDASTVVRVHGVDGVHMTAADHRVLGDAVAAVVKRLLARPVPTGGE